MLRPAPESRRARTRMVMRHLAGRGIRDQRVLAAMRWAPREWFLPPHLAGDAYSDGPLPIGSGQTISQPYIVALMTERLRPRGAGTGAARFSEKRRPHVDRSGASRRGQERRVLPGAHRARGARRAGDFGGSD